MPLDNFKARVDRFGDFDFKEALHDIVVDNADTLADLQAEMMAKGIDKNDQPVTLDGNFYTSYTIYRKERYGKGLGAVTDRITRYQTGALYRGLKAVVSNDTFTFESDVDYWPTLLARTGEQSIELDSEACITFQKEITLPNLTEKFNQTVFQ